MMPSNHYHFVTHWRIPGNIHNAFDILSRPRDYPKWWPGIEVPAGDSSPGHMKIKGWLPYTLRWELLHTQLERPYRIVSDSAGDFVGRGIWTLEQNGPDVEVVFDWDILAEKKFLRLFSFLFKPFFIANHNAVMEKARQGFIRELARIHL